MFDKEILVVALLAVVVAGWFAASGVEDDDTAPPVTRAAQPSPTPSETSEGDARMRKKTGTPHAFPPMDEEAREAISRAGLLAMNEKFDQANEAVLRATALENSLDPLHDFTGNWYSETGRERLALPLLIVAERMGARWAGDEIEFRQRQFTADELEEIEQEADRLWARYMEIKREVATRQ